MFIAFFYSQSADGVCTPLNYRMLLGVLRNILHLHRGVGETWGSQTTQDQVLPISLIPMNHNYSNSIITGKLLRILFPLIQLKFNCCFCHVPSTMHVSSLSLDWMLLFLWIGESIFPSNCWVCRWPYQCTRILIQDLSLLQWLHKRKGFIINYNGGRKTWTMWYLPLRCHPKL